MAISRAQMHTQLKGGTMKKTTKKRTLKRASGGDMGDFSHDASGVPGAEDMGAGDVGAILEFFDNYGASSVVGKAKSGRNTRAAPTRGMKAGGKVRGDGVCIRGKTKGTIR